LRRSFREAELIHGRWAMLGAAGALAVEALGYGGWLENAGPNALAGEPLTYFGNKARAVPPHRCCACARLPCCAWAAAGRARPGWQSSRPSPTHFGRVA
jgi:hypothetical protein